MVKKRILKKVAKRRTHKKERIPAKSKAVKRSKEARPSKPKEEPLHRLRVKVIGIGGGGSAIAGELAQLVSRIEFVAANTDAQALRKNSSRLRMFAFGQKLTGGLGAGMNPEIGEKAAKTEKERIKNLMVGQDLCILLATLGGGTGSGAIPVFCQAAQEAGCLALGVFTLPFHFEGEKRQQIALRALERSRPLLNATLLIPNERIFTLIERNTSLQDAFSAVNKRLAEALEGLAEMLYLPGIINIDFADLRSLMEGKGRLAYLSSVKAGGPVKTQEAVRLISHNPLLEYGLEGVERILFSIASDRSMKMQEVAEVSSAISAANPKAKIVFGLSHNPGLKERLQVTLFAVGCKEGKVEKKRFPRNPRKRKPQAKKEAPEEVQKKEEKEPEVKKPVVKKRKRRTPRAPRPRRNALEVKEAADREMQEFEEQEKQWDVPAFLRRQLGKEF
ncbi:cell division FtsZ family protein [Patescibacteria group bacterium]|nr:cell division FtsZ family protein [Patescibacteria group bacterium]